VTVGLPQAGFVPPPYPYDRLEGLRGEAIARHGACVDLSVGTPFDPPAVAVVEALARSGSERGYPMSVGSLDLRAAAVDWLSRRLAVAVEVDAVAACIGTKELVAGLPHWLRLRNPERDTVLYPAVSYPTYAMGAQLAGCRAVEVPLDDDWSIDLAAIAPEDAERAVCLWVNTPGNPAGGLDDLAAAAGWGRAHGVPVLSDECYVEFTWDGPPRTILAHGLDGVIAVHSLSKRSNLAGVRVGFYAGDAELVTYLRDIRKHAGFMVPGPCQAAAIAALADDEHVDEQRARYAERLVAGRELLAAAGIEAPPPRGGFYLWAPAPDGDAWAAAADLAQRAGVLVSPGDFYGRAGSAHIRVALVRPVEELRDAAARLS
jgi:succinyldiaminopimelate transaminase